MGESFRSPAKVARRLRVLPSAARRIKNWPSFVFNYALGLVPAEPYVFRNASRLQIGRAVDHAVIREVFLREEYGSIADGSVIIDIGANIGAFAVYATAEAEDIRVYAYEPFGPFFDLLERNVALNKKQSCVQCFNRAVAAVEAERDLHVAGAGLLFPTFAPSASSSSTIPQPVACTTLPAILAENSLSSIDLLKMDCEGAEYEILYSAPSAALRKIREVRMEYHNLDAERCNVQQLKRHLSSAGFKMTREIASSATHGLLWASQTDVGHGTR